MGADQKKLLLLELRRAKRKAANEYEEYDYEEASKFFPGKEVSDVQERFQSPELTLMSLLSFRLPRFSPPMASASPPSTAGTTPVTAARRLPSRSPSAPPNPPTGLRPPPRATITRDATLSPLTPSTPSRLRS